MGLSDSPNSPSLLAVEPPSSKKSYTVNREKAAFPSFIMTSGLRWLSVIRAIYLIFSEVIERSDESFTKLYHAGKWNLVIFRSEPVAKKTKSFWKQLDLKILTCYSIIGGQLRGRRGTEAISPLSSGNWIEIRKGTPFCNNWKYRFW